MYVATAGVSLSHYWNDRYCLRRRFRRSVSLLHSSAINIVRLSCSTWVVWHWLLWDTAEWAIWTAAFQPNLSTRPSEAAAPAVFQLLNVEKIYFECPRRSQTECWTKTLRLRGLRNVCSRFRKCLTLACVVIHWIRAVLMVVRVFSIRRIWNLCRRSREDERNRRRNLFIWNCLCIGW